MMLFDKRFEAEDELADEGAGITEDMLSEIGSDDTTEEEAESDTGGETDAASEHAAETDDSAADELFGEDGDEEDIDHDSFDDIDHF